MALSRQLRHRPLASACFIVLMALFGSPRALAGAPSYCSVSGTPLPAPVVEGGAFGFSVAADASASTIAVGQPDAEGGVGLQYAYNQVALCAYQSYALPTPPAPAAADSGEDPGMMGMMTALSRDGKWMAVAGNLEADNTMAQVYIYRRQSNDSSGGFTFHQKLPLQAAPAAAAGAGPGTVHAGSLSISRDGRLVAISWSVYGDGLDVSSPDPYGAPSVAVQGSAQLYRRASEAGLYKRAQADLARISPPYARTQFFGANSYIVAAGTLLAVSTRVVDAARPGLGSPAIVVYRRLSKTGAFAYANTLKTPVSDGTFVMTESGSHLAVLQGSDVVVYVLEGSLSTGKFVFNKRCTMDGTDMDLQATFTKMAMTVASGTLRLAIGNSLDSVFVWSLPLGGKRAYSDGSCPAVLDGTLTGGAGSRFGAALAVSENGRTLVVGVPGGGADGDTGVLVVDIAPPRPPPSPAPSALAPPPSASGAALDSSYYLTNPSTVLVSARRGSVGVPASQPFDLNAWSRGSPGGAPYSAESGYSIAPVNPYMSGGTTVQNSVVSVTSVLRGLGLTTAALRNVAANVAAARTAGWCARRPAPAAAGQLASDTIRAHTSVCGGHAARHTLCVPAAPRQAAA
ncbi:MAG: hypothetical protein J3K34DRAFT_158219 [Monoraphidium minutum]|nr:MAG: hypothetical protein J3K34DRAFT_158219 [Monoraphidium minutum]